MKNSKKLNDIQLSETNLDSKQIVDNSVVKEKDGVVIVRIADKKIVYVNDVFYDNFNITKENVIEKSIIDLPFWREKDDHEKIFSVLNQSSKFNSFETTISVKKGKIIPVAIFGGIIQFDYEECIFTIIRNLSRIKQTEKYILESDVKYRTLFEQANNAIFLEDESTKILDANKAASDLFGYSHKELLSMKMSDLLIRKEDDLETYSGTMASSPVEVLATKKDGKTFWIDMTVAPLTIDGTNRYLSIIRNITDRRILEEQLEQAAKMETVGRFTGSIAHDFNNLLTVIQGFSELALTFNTKDKTIHNYLVEINKAANKAELLISQLLSFSKKQNHKRNVFDLNSLVADLKKMIERIIGENIEFDVQLYKKSVYIEADSNQIEQVILNLVVNARDAMSHNGKLNITTDRIYIKSSSLKKHNLKTTGYYIILQVGDTGCGIDQNLQDKIFEPFFTTKEGKKGTGFGLATVNRIISQLNGKIDLQSSKDDGTIFRIFLPEVKNIKTREQKSTEKSKNYNGTETVLVVEDQDKLRSVICQTLEKQGYKVYNAENGIKAIALFRKVKENINLLLTDIIMPKMNGFELARSLVDEDPKIKTLFMSGYNEEIAKIKESYLTKNNYIQKPFTSPTLLKKLRDILNSH